MTAAELDAAARAFYEACTWVAPTWEQLGDVTKSVWREYVLAGKDLA